ncbi:MAG: hypothetical protein KJN97_03885, partial [Deltaproteobacteria bacterium]|nr:hypothetical protein [Deltaproteobacteria bacterium]
MNWTENWPTVLMWGSVLLIVGTLFAVLRFLRNASDPQDELDWPPEEDLKETRPDRRPSTRGFVPVGVLAIMVAMAVSYVAFAHRPDGDRVLPPDGVLWTPEALLRDFFPSSERVAYQQMSLTPEELADLE